MGLARSMIIYLAAFTLSLALFWFSENGQIYVGVTRGVNAGTSNDGTARRHGAFLAALAILIVSLLAGLRASSVGVDTSLYPVVNTNMALRYSNFIDYLLDQPDIGAEPLSALVVWLCSRLDCGTAPLLFSYQLLTIVPVYLAARKFDGRLSVTIAMAVYLFFFYNNSLNMMRQSVSCALFLLSFAEYYSHGKVNKASVFAAACALLFHRSAAYGLVLMLSSLLIARSNRKWLRYAFYALLIASPLAMVRVANWMDSGGFGDSHMQTYIKVFITGEIEKDWYINPLGRLSLVYLFIYSTMIFLPKIYRLPIFNGLGLANATEDNSRDKVAANAFRVLNMTGYLIYVVVLFVLNTVYGQRFSLYLDFFLILAIPLSCEGGLSAQKKILLVMLLITFWIVWVIRLGWSGSSVYLFYFE